jgi:hypothetical protein
MSEVLIKENVHGLQGRNVIPRRFFRSWALCSPWAFRFSFISAELLSDRIRLKLFFIILTDRLFADIERIEIRSGYFNKCLIGIIPRPPLYIKTFFWVRRGKEWIMDFKRYGLRLEYIDCSESKFYSIP